MFPHLRKRLSQDRHESQINLFIAVAHLYSLSCELSTRRGTSQMKMLAEDDHKTFEQTTGEVGSGDERRGDFYDGSEKKFEV